MDVNLTSQDISAEEKKQTELSVSHDGHQKAHVVALLFFLSNTHLTVSDSQTISEFLYASPTLHPPLQSDHKHYTGIYKEPKSSIVQGFENEELMFLIKKL